MDWSGVSMPRSKAPLNRNEEAEYKVFHLKTFVLSLVSIFHSILEIICHIFKPKEMTKLERSMQIWQRRSATKPNREMNASAVWARVLFVNAVNLLNSLYFSSMATLNCRLQKWESRSLQNILLLCLPVCIPLLHDCSPHVAMATRTGSAQGRVRREGGRKNGEEESTCTLLPTVETLGKFRRKDRRWSPTSCLTLTSFSIATILMHVYRSTSSCLSSSTHSCSLQPL